MARPPRARWRLYDAFRAGAQTLSAVTAWQWTTFRIRDTEFSTIRGKFVSCNYMSAHMGPMLLGRGFVENDCSTAGGQPVTVLTEIGWTTRFKRDPAIVGRTLNLNNQLVTVIGVAPNDAPGEPDVAADLRARTPRASREYFRDPSRHAWLDISGRLAPGRSVDQANAELNVMAAGLDRLHPGRTTKILVTNGALFAGPGTRAGEASHRARVRHDAPLAVDGVHQCHHAVAGSRSGTPGRDGRASVAWGHSLTAAAATAHRIAGPGVRRRCAQPGLWRTTWRVRLRRWSPVTPSITASFALDWRVLGYTWGLAVVAGCTAGLTPRSSRFGPDSPAEQTTRRAAALRPRRSCAVR